MAFEPQSFTENDKAINWQRELKAGRFEKVEYDPILFENHERACLGGMALQYAFFNAWN